jgi:hypothetical protein
MAVREPWVWGGLRARPLDTAHNSEDPRCERWTGDHSGMNWDARCPTCDHGATPIWAAVEARAKEMSQPAPSPVEDRLIRVLVPVGIVLAVSVVVSQLWMFFT